jgi:ABC-2 type transport system ATP-binding protein
VAAITVEGLSKSYGAVQAVSDVSFEVEAGRVFALLGPNGAGKTTTVEILEGFRDRDRGRVKVLDYDPGDSVRSRGFRQRIGIVLQELAVEPYLSVREVLQRNAGYYPHPRPVDEVIELVGLTEKADARVKTLSGGQQRRLDVGLGIVGDPELVFLDEPTTGFDPSARRGAWDLIRALSGTGTTVLLTTHYMDEAEALADRVAIVAGGRIVAEGTPETLGGRDVGEVSIKFRLPPGRSPSELPVPGAVLDSGQVEIKTDDEVKLLHEVTGWALDNRVELAGLSVERLTLEDVYLRLTAGAGDHDDQPANEGRSTPRSTLGRARW